MKFNIKDFLINALIAFLPIAIIFTILEENGFTAYNIGAGLSALIKFGVFFGLIYLAGKLRKYVKGIRKLG